MLAQNNGFAASYDGAKAAISNYLTTWEALATDYNQRGWKLSDLDGRLGEVDRTIVEGSERVPGRSSGKSLTEELSDKAMKLAYELMERIKQLVEKVAPSAAPLQSQHARPSPSI